MATKTDTVIPDGLANDERRACFRKGFKLFYKFEQEADVMSGDQYFVCSVQLRPHSVVARASMAAHGAEHIQVEQRFYSVLDAPVAFVDCVREGLDLVKQAA